MDKDEIKNSPPAEKRSRLSQTKWAGSALFAIVVVGCFCFAAWLFFVLQNHILGEENTFGNVTISPYGYKRHSLVNQSWDSIAISGENFKIFLKNPRFQFSRKDSIFLKVEANTVNVHIKPSKEEKNIVQDSSFKIPEIPKFSLPFKTKISVEKAVIAVDTSLQYSLKRISLENENKKSLLLKGDSIQGSFIESPINARINALWQDENINLKAQFFSKNDSIETSLVSPRKNLLAGKVTTSLHIKEPLEYFKKYPEEAPVFRNLELQVEATIDSSNKNLNYKTKIKTQMDEFFPLPTLQMSIEASGDTSKTDVWIKASAPNGGKIDLQGRVNKELDAEVKGFVTNIKGLFGPEWMPLDATIHSAQKRGNMLYAKASTPVGSNVDATIRLYPNFHIDYTGDIAPNEPWAVQWSKGRLRFKDRPQVKGEFSYEKAEMKADVKIGYIPEAYFMTADSLETTLILRRNGIRFPYGKIFSKWESFDFTGEVMWKDEKPHTSWEVIASDKGVATAYIDTRTPSIKATADNVLLSTIPFAKRFVPGWADGRVTGTYEHNFDIDTAFAIFDLDAQLQKFKTKGNFHITKKQDTVALAKAELFHEQNKIDLQATIVLPNEETPKRMLPVEILNAWVSTRAFSIPLSLLPLNDSTLSDGNFSGDLTYTDSHGFRGNIEFQNIAFRNIPKESFAIKEMHLFAERAKAELDAYLEIGEGTWSGRAQVTFDQILAAKKHFSIAFITNNGGNIWGDGFLDSTLTASIKTDGYWLLPNGVGELQSTDLRLELFWQFNRGLNGISGTFYTDSTVYSPLKFNYAFPVQLEGKIFNRNIVVEKASTSNAKGENIEASLTYALDLMRLQELRFWTTEYSLNHKEHELLIRNLDGKLTEANNSINITADIPEINYSFLSETYGNAKAKAKGNLNYRIPKNQEKNERTVNQLDGNILIDKLTYQKDIDIEITPKTVMQLLTSFQNTLKNLNRKSETQAKSNINKSNPINLDVKISDSQSDSIAIVSSFAIFPFTIDLNVKGTTNRPTLEGEIVNAGEGFIGFKDLYEFDIQTFLVSWQNVPWQQGQLEITTSQELPYCVESDEIKDETCPVHIDIQGTITNPQPNPYSYCGGDASTATTYYNILLGCISENPSEEAVDWNRLAGSAIGKILSTTANKTLGGNYIGNIDMKMRIFSNTETLEEDSSYVKIPISLDRWVKNLSVILGYTQDKSENPTYEQAFEFGINYKLPFFKEKEYSHPDHLNPELSLGAMLVSKQYQVQTGSQENENYLEKNIGFLYSYRFWSPCILGLGSCEDFKEENKTKGETHDK